MSEMTCLFFKEEGSDTCVRKSHVWDIPEKNDQKKFLVDKALAVGFFGVSDPVVRFSHTGV